jgi:hypothetical protein
VALPSQLAQEGPAGEAYWQQFCAEAWPTQVTAGDEQMSVRNPTMVGHLMICLLVAIALFLPRGSGRTSCFGTVNRFMDLR